MDDPSGKLVRSRLLQGIPTTQDTGVWSNNGVLGHGDFEVMTPGAVDDAILALNLGSASQLDSSDLVLESSRNAANGFLGLDSSGNALGTFIGRYGTEAEINGIVPALGELAIKTDTNELVRGDGSTAGGLLLGPSQRWYYTASGGTVLTSTSINDYSQSFSVAAGGAYRLEGFFNFTNDTDNQSNFLMTLVRSGCTFAPPANTALSPLTTLVPAVSLNAQWQMGGDTTSAVLNKVSFSSTSIPSFSVVDTTKASGVLYLTMLFGIATAGSLSLAARLRVAKVGTPTIKVQGQFCVTRLR